jgi:hypothetical protein
MPAAAVTASSQAQSLMGDNDDVSCAGVEGLGPGGPPPRRRLMELEPAQPWRPEDARPSGERVAASMMQAAGTCRNGVRTPSSGSTS